MPFGATGTPKMISASRTTECALLSHGWIASDRVMSRGADAALKSRGADAALKSRGGDAPGVAQLREEVASLRGDVDHIRSAMQDMHREVGSAVLLLSRFMGLEWDTGEAVRLAEKRSASASDAVDRLSDDIGNLEHRLAVAGEPRPENARDGGGGRDATSETAEDKLGGSTSETVEDRLGDAAPPKGRQDSGGAAAGGGGAEEKGLQSDRPRRSQDREPPHPRSDIQGALPQHRDDHGSKGGISAPATSPATDDHVKGSAAEGEGAGAKVHRLEDGPRCSGKQGLPSLSLEGEEGALLSRRPSVGGGVGGPTLPAVKRSQEGTTMAAVATAEVAAVATAAVVAPQQPYPLGGGALAPDRRALPEEESSTRLRLPREEPLPVLGVGAADVGGSASTGHGVTEAKETDQDKDKRPQGGEEEGDQGEKKGREEVDVREEGEEEEEKEKDGKKETEKDENEEEEEEEIEKAGVARAKKSAYPQSGRTSLTLTGGPFSDKHGDSARQPLVAKASSGQSESDSSGSGRRGEDDASGEFDVSAGGREGSGSRSMPLDDRGAAVKHAKHRASGEERSTAGDNTATPPANPPASPPVVSVRSNSGSGGGGGGGGGRGGRNADDASSQTSGSWTSRSGDSRSSEQSASSSPPSSRGRGGPDRQVVERGRPSRAAAAVTAVAEAASGAKTAVVESVPNGDNDGGVLESGDASIHAGGRGSQNRFALRITVDGVPPALGPVKPQGSRIPSLSDIKADTPILTPRLSAPLGTRRREREEQEESSVD